MSRSRWQIGLQLLLPGQTRIPVTDAVEPVGQTPLLDLFLTLLMQGAGPL